MVEPVKVAAVGLEEAAAAAAELDNVRDDDREWVGRSFVVDAVVDEVVFGSKEFESPNNRKSAEESTTPSQPPIGAPFPPEMPTTTPPAPLPSSKHLVVNAVDEGEERPTPQLSLPQQQGSLLPLSVKWLSPSPPKK